LRGGTEPFERAAAGMMESGRLAGPPILPSPHLERTGDRASERTDEGASGRAIVASPPPSLCSRRRRRRRRARRAPLCLSNCPLLRGPSQPHVLTCRFRSSMMRSILIFLRPMVAAAFLGGPRRRGEEGGTKKEGGEEEELLSRLSFSLLGARALGLARALRGLGTGTPARRGLRGGPRRLGEGQGRRNPKKALFPAVLKRGCACVDVLGRRACGCAGCSLCENV
jgi:hypothetical protein